jgi:hypothetical protein
MQDAIGRTIKSAAVLLTVLSITITTPALADGWRGGWGGYGWHGGGWHGGGFGWRGYGGHFYSGRFGFGIGFPGWHGLPIYGWYPPPPPPPPPQPIVYVLPRPQPPQGVYANPPPPAPSPPLAVVPKPKTPHHVVHHAAVHHPYCHCCCGIKMGDPPKSDPPKINPKMGVGSFRSSFVQRTSGDPEGDPPKKMVDGHLSRWNQAGQYISIQQIKVDK